MIEETGRVVAVQDGFAWIEAESASACSGCALHGGCGTGVIARLLGRRPVQLRVANPIGAGVGETVVIGISANGLLQGSLAVYAMPLAGLFAGALAGQQVAGESAAIAGALAGLATGLVWLLRYSRRNVSDTRFQPVVLRRKLPVQAGKQV